MTKIACLPLLIVSGVIYGQAGTGPVAGTGDLARARVFSPDSGTSRRMANGGQSREFVQGTLATGEAIAIHESVQPAGTKPNAPHAIQHSEFILVREGTLAFEHDGVTEQAGPGDILYVAYGTRHTVRNVGATPARYVVIAIGSDEKKRP